MRDFSVPHAKDGDNSDPDPELPNITDEEWPIEVYDGEIEEDLDRFSSITDTERVFGRLSFASKMPYSTFNLPASACRTGAKLRPEIAVSIVAELVAVRNLEELPESYYRTSLAGELSRSKGKGKGQGPSSAETLGDQHA